MSRPALFAALLLLSACATTGPTPMEEIPNRPVAAADPTKPREVAVTDVFVSKAEPPFACKQLAGISLDYDRGEYDADIAAMRKLAGEAGGNYFVIDGRMMGRAYWCARPCMPECSPGYTCVESSCVSACNPACKSGERCGADRSCHRLEPVGTES